MFNKNKTFLENLENFFNEVRLENRLSVITYENFKPESFIAVGGFLLGDMEFARITEVKTNKKTGRRTEKVLKIAYDYNSRRIYESVRKKKNLLMNFKDTEYHWKANDRNVMYQLFVDWVLTEGYDKKERMDQPKYFFKAFPSSVTDRLIELGHFEKNDYTVDELLELEKVTGANL